MHDNQDKGGGSRDSYDEEDAPLIDVGLIRELIGYVVRAVRRHRKLALGVVVTIVAVTFGVLKTLPKTYHVETKLLAQKDAGGIGAKNPFGPDPLRGASDIVMGHENLVSLVKQLDLVPWWKEHRAPASRAKDALFSLLGRQATDEEQAQGLVGLLETRLGVAPGDGTVVIGIDWPDGVMGARLVDTAQQNFLERRHVMEISTIAESVSILEEHATRLRKEIEDLIGQEQKPEEKTEKAVKPPDGAAPAAAPTPAPVQRRAAAPKRRPEVDADLARRKVMIEAKTRAMNDLDDFRRRRLLDLQSQLAEQRSKYTDQHPVVLSIQQNIDAISQESPQVQALRAEVKSLQDEYDRARREAEGEGASAGGGGGFAVAGAAAPLPSEVTSMLQGGAAAERDPATAAQLSYAVSKYSEIRAQISSARIELDLAQAAFRYRYTVVIPAEPPPAPIKPKVPAVMAAATIGSIVLAILAAVVAELRSGRIVNRWQVERLLKVPVLAELHAPPEDGQPRS